MIHPSYGNHVRYLVFEDEPTIVTGIAQRRLFESGTYYYEIARDGTDGIDRIICYDIIETLEKETV